MIRRREFITVLGGAAAWPVAARAQQPGRVWLGGAAAWPLVARAQVKPVRRIGVVIGSTEKNPETTARLAAFRQGLQERGWSESRNVSIDYRFALDSTDQFQAVAKELVALQPDVIFAHSTPIVAALQRESRTIPTVFVSVSDPIGEGFIANLARPGGNHTGVLLFEAGIVGKWMAMLKQIAPRLMRVALMANPETTAYDYFLRSAEAAKSSLAVELAPSHIETATDIERAIESFAHAPNMGLAVLPDNTNNAHRDLIIALTAKHRLPTVYTAQPWVTAGGLMSYGTNQVQMFRQAASYVDRILRGEKPADLPVQAPTKYETALNLKTAKALGLTVPPALLVAADEVIE
jgi:ABC-type uncharacterized transport system substrate-binding protein